MKQRHGMLMGFLAAGLAGALLVAAGSMGLLRAAVREQFLERARADTALLAGWIASLEPGQAQGFAVEASRRLGVRITLIAEDGSVLGDSALDPRNVARMESHLDRPEVQAARQGVTGDSLRRSATTNEEFLYSARRTEGRNAVGYVRIAVPAARVWELQERLGGLILVVALGTFLPLALFAYAAVRRLSRPLEAMAEGLERASQGAADVELPTRGGEEILRLSAAVRRTQTELLARIGELDAERRVLASVVSGMKEGLLLLGSDQRVRLANDAARAIFEVRFDPLGHQLAEIVRHPTVIRDVELALREGKDVRESPMHMDGSGRSFELRVTPLAGAGGRPSGVLLLLFDVSRLEALERVRRDFVANVSHELRTPLTAIKASVESLLEDELSGDVRRFLEIVRNNADHMGDLIEDLTDLSLIETGSVALSLAAVDVAALVRDLAERVGPVARAKQVEIEVDLPLRFPIWADRRRLEQMLTNLIDNAIKFNRPDGRVRVHATLDAGRPVLAVEDTGVGIPADSLGRVFNRFFQVNRERSRQIRGTGLGLAIVKHLMRLHGGTVRVESELGRGSTFVLEFPPRPEPEPAAPTSP